MVAICFKFIIIPENPLGELAGMLSISGALLHFTQGLDIIRRDVVTNEHTPTRMHTAPEVSICKHVYNKSALTTQIQSRDILTANRPC